MREGVETMRTDRLYFFIVFLFILSSGCASMKQPYSKVLADLSDIDKQKRIDAIGRAADTLEGEGAYNIIYPSLSDPEVDVRMAALNAIRIFEEKRKIVSIEKRIKSSNVKVRNQAVSEIFYINDRFYKNDKRIYRLIITGLKDSDKTVKITTISGIGKKQDERFITALAALLDKQSDEVYKEVSSALVPIGELSFHYLMGRILDKDISIEAGRLMIDTIAAFNYRIPEQFVADLKRADVKLRWYALDRLRDRIKNELPSFGVLIEILKDEKEPAVSVELLKILRATSEADPAIYDVIYQLLMILNDQGENKAVQLAAANSLVSMNTDIAVPSMANLLKMGGRGGKLYTLKIMEHLGMPVFYPFLAEAVEDDEIQRDVLEVLINRYPVKSIGLFIDILKEDKQELFKYAVSGLISAGNTASSKTAALLDDKRLNVRLTALNILLKIAGSEEIPVFINLLLDDNEEIRAKSAFILGKLKAEDAVMPLINAMLKDKNNLLQMNSAVGALINIGKSSALPLLSILKNSTVVRERIYAAWILANIGYSEAMIYIKEMMGDMNREHGLFVLKKSNETGSFSLAKEDALVSAFNILKDKR